MANSDYMVGNAPAAGSFVAPLIGFQLGHALAQLPQQYFDGTQRARTLAMQNAFPNGVPRQADGSPDVDQVVDKTAQVGGLEYVRPMLNFMAAQQSAKQASQDLASSATPAERTLAPQVSTGGDSQPPALSTGQGDAATADRYQRAAQVLRSKAAGYAGLKNRELAQAFEKQAEAYEGRAKQIYDLIAKQARSGEP
jgi:hypothetical protein